MEGRLTEHESESGARASSGLAREQLRMVCDFDPGVHRVGSPGAFAYVYGGGSPIDDAATLERIRSLAIPPAWIQVWIAADPAAHLQATGIDSRGRKQYRYHPEWRHERDDVKFHDMEDFARAQPALRIRISEALGSGERLGHRRVLGLALRLLDVGLFRVGSDRYARDNRHYGLTTLRRDQVAILGDAARFDYVGKAGKRQQLSIVDAPSVEVLQELARRRGAPEELLVFLGGHGPTRIRREDVNNFLRAESGGPFSAKEYRTWNATVIAAATLASERPAATHAPVVASRAVAQALGNTPAVARQSYIDPRVFARYQAGATIEAGNLAPDPWDARAQVESRVLALVTG
jgi:DNA topoisomerase-1